MPFFLLTWANSHSTPRELKNHNLPTTSKIFLLLSLWRPRQPGDLVRLENVGRPLQPVPPQRPQHPLGISVVVVAALVVATQDVVHLRRFSTAPGPRTIPVAIPIPVTIPVSVPPSPPLPLSQRGRGGRRRRQEEQDHGQLHVSGLPSYRTQQLNCLRTD